MGITTPQDQKKWVSDMYQSLPNSDLSIISVDGMVSNKGRYDNLMVGGVAAIMTSREGGLVWTWTQQWALGTDITQYDVDLFMLAKAA